MNKSPLPSNYTARLIEKLRLQVAVNGPQSPAAEELARLLHPVEGEPSEAPEGDTEISSDGVTNG